MRMSVLNSPIGREGEMDLKDESSEEFGAKSTTDQSKREAYRKAARRVLRSPKRGVSRSKSDGPDLNRLRQSLHEHDAKSNARRRAKDDSEHHKSYSSDEDASENEDDDGFSLFGGGGILQLGLGALEKLEKMYDGSYDRKSASDDDV